MNRDDIKVLLWFVFLFGWFDVLVDWWKEP